MKDTQANMMKKSHDDTRIWPKSFLPKIDESNYNIQTLMKVLGLSIPGIMFLIMSAVILLFSVLLRARTIQPRAVVVMNVVSFGLVLLVMHLIKRKITGTSNDVSLTLLFRYYNFGCLCMILLVISYIIYMSGMQKGTNPYQMHLAKYSHIMFDVCLVLVFLLSTALTAFPGTVRERIMRFFWMWPMDNGSETKPNKLLHVLWIARQIIQVFVIGYCGVATRFIVERMEFDNKKDHLRYNAFRCYFGAAFCEEFFKFFIAASVPFISKYSKNKSAILHACIVVGLAFDLVENIGYSTSIGLGLIFMIRILGFCAHFVFAYPTALAITRQRDSILWILEVLAGFSLGVLSHGSFNYMLGIDSLTYISVFLLMPGFLIIGLYILIKNPFLPKDELAQNVNCIPHNRMHTGNPNYVPNTRNPPNRAVDV